MSPSFVFFFGIFVSSLLSALPNSADIDLWEAFKLTFNKTYRSNEEEEFRLQVFLNNTRIIDELNEQYKQQRGAIFHCEVNHFSDLTQEEFVAKFTGLRTKISVPLASILARKIRKIKKRARKLEKGSMLDWRRFGAVTEVANQGECGSCWIFSANGAIEGQIFRKTGRLVSLSEQLILDCVHTNISDGCTGGFMTDVFEWAIRNGINLREDYSPYMGESQICQCSLNDRARYFISKYEVIPPGSEIDLERAVEEIGPISVGMDASSPSFQFYAQGIYFEPECNSTNINHAVVVIGFGVSEDGTEYWIVKNSWSDLWGESGYFRLVKGSNMCGIATLASYPLL